MFALPPYNYFNVIYGLSMSDDPETVRYVGQTRDLKSRIKGHLQYAKNPSTPVHYWISSHSEYALHVRILEQLESPEELDSFEIKWISDLDTYIKNGTGGLNCDIGGKASNSSGYSHDKKTRDLIGSHCRGELAPNSILTEDDVLEIREKYFSRQSMQSALAEEFGVSRSTVAGIIRRRKWTHLPVSETEKNYTGRQSHQKAFTSEDVFDIRKRLSQGETASSIARSYDVRHSTILNIKSGATYTWVI